MPQEFNMILESCRLENQSVLAKYEAIWDRYKKRYESKGNAKELTKIKKDAMKNKEECKRLANDYFNTSSGFRDVQDSNDWKL